MTSRNHTLQRTISSTLELCSRAINFARFPCVYERRFLSTRTGVGYGWEPSTNMAMDTDGTVGLGAAGLLTESSMNSWLAQFHKAWAWIICAAFIVALIQGIWNPSPILKTTSGENTAEANCARLTVAEAIFTRLKIPIQLPAVIATAAYAEGREPEHGKCEKKKREEGS